MLVIRRFRIFIRLVEPNSLSGDACPTKRISETSLLLSRDLKFLKNSKKQALWLNLEACYLATLSCLLGLYLAASDKLSYLLSLFNFVFFFFFFFKKKKKKKKKKK